VDSQTLLFGSLIVLAALLVLLATIAVVRKIVVRAGDRRRHEHETTIRPTLLALIGNDGDDPESLETLVTATRERGRAVERLAVEYLPKVRGEAHGAVVELLERRGVIRRAVARSHRHGAVGRARAAELAGAVGSMAAVDGLLDLLRDHDADVRSTAARALGKIGAPRAVGPLLLTLSSRRRIPRGVITRAIAQIGSVSCDELRRALECGTPPARALAAEMLGILGAFAATADLVRAMERDPELEVRLRAARALGRIGMPAAVGPLAEVVRSDVVAPMRAIAARSLGEIGDATAVPALLGWVSSPDYWVAHNAAHALAALGSDGARALR